MRIPGIGSKLPLGAMRDTVYGGSSLNLRNGGILLVFTDGIPDARNSARDFYEYEMLRKLIERMDTAGLSAKEIRDGIIEDVRRFTGDAPQNQDMIVVKSV